MLNCNKHTKRFKSKSRLEILTLVYKSNVNFKEM